MKPYHQYKEDINTDTKTDCTYLSKNLLNVEKTISAKIAILLVQVDVLKEVAKEVRETKCNSSLARELNLDIVANITRKMQFRLLSTELDILTATHHVNKDEF